MVREVAVRLEVAANGLDLRKSLEHGLEHAPAHAVGRVDHDAERLDGARIDEREDTLEERGPDVLFLDAALAGDFAEALQSAVANFRESRVASNGQGASAHDLETGVLLGVVRGGAGDAAVELQRIDCEVEHLRTDQPDVDHVGASFGCSLRQRRHHLRARDAHVVPDGDPLRAEFLDIGPPDRVGALLVDLGRVDPANVVGLEDIGLEHGRDAIESRRRSGLLI